MFKNRNDVKAILRSLFSRYLRGEADLDEQKFVEDFYEDVPTDDASDQNSIRIGVEIKQEIDKKIHKEKNLVSRYRIYIPAAACLVVLFVLFGKYAYNYYTTQQFAVSSRVYQVGPSIKIGGKHFVDLQRDLPQGSFFEEVNQQEILNMEHVAYNQENELVVIDNPADHDFIVALRDGSQVRLSPRASVRFASDFNQRDRLVKVQGEVFFDVAKQVKNDKPVHFIVQTDMQTIEVLGTQFTVDARVVGEENVHLLEGRVKLTHNDSKSTVLLQPGQRAYLAKDQPKIFVLNGDNDEKVNAWRNGLFYFEDRSLHSVMDELSVWYDVKIHVNSNVGALPITGTFSRYEQVEQVLEIIAMTNKIHFYEKKGVIYVSRR